ncbi:hypothetical protein D5086_024923 [Populus alba]|uniref:Uncharacterized protein n=1 Tax=Populus alba TaxID=43335 RepID=A0ACC4B6W4_POPAL
MSGGKPSSKRKGVEEYEDASVNTEVELHVEHDAIFHDHVPIVSYYNDRITPLLDAVDRLRQLQANIIAKCLPDIVRKIDEKLKKSISELNGMPRRLVSVAEVMAAFSGIIGSSQESLRKILQKVEEISELPIRFVEKVWAYIDGVVISVLDRHSENYHRLQLFIRRVAHKLVAKMKDRSIDWLSIRNLLYKEMEKEIFNELVDTAGDVIEGMLEEPPSVANKRERLNTSIKLLRESKEVICVFESAKLDFFCAAYFAISCDSFYVQALQMFNPIPFYVLFSIFPTLVFPSTVISQGKGKIGSMKPVLICELTLVSIDHNHRSRSERAYGQQNIVQVIVKQQDGEVGSGNRPEETCFGGENYQ